MYMNSDNIKINDPLQLQQMIIFLKAELVKYQSEVKKYHTGFHYSVIEKLEQENEQLTDEKNELSEELYRLNKELIKRTIDYQEQIHLHEMQNKEYSTSIDVLQKTKTDLQTTNQQLTTAIKKLKDGFNANQYKSRKNDRQVSALHRKLTDSKMTIEQLEPKLVDLIQDAHKQLVSQIEKLDTTKQERDQSDNVKQHLLQEIAEKNNTIEKIQLELSELKEQNGKLIADNKPSPKNDIPPAIAPFSSTIDSKTLTQLDHQIKKLLVQSVDYEKELDAKLLVLHALDHELSQLSAEIDTIKIFSIGGKFLKEL